MGAYNTYGVPDAAPIDPIEWAEHSILNGVGVKKIISVETNGEASSDLQFKWAVSGDYVYLGESASSVSGATSLWRIQRVDTSTGSISFADTVTTFTKKWDDRATYTY